MACKGPTMSARLDELFKTCDTKGDGVIGPQAFRDLCHKFGISEVDSDAIFNDLDHDGDGQIDFDDFSYGFRDFLTPGSRRGSLQIPLVLTNTNNNNNNDESSSNSGGKGVSNDFLAYQQQLEEMERKHASARNAWKQFTNNVGISSPVIAVKAGEQLYEIVEEIRTENGSEVSTKLEKALSSLISDVQTLHEEYKTLECSFRKEREVHAAQLAALGEELDQQLARTEAKAKAEAREEAQKQMDAERKKIASEMEHQMSDLSAQLNTFKKVEQWLSEEEALRTSRTRGPEETVKLIEAESENRNLKSALVEAQMKATLLQSQLTQKRNEYIHLYQEFHSEKVAASEYKNQVDLMQNHLSILSQANRVLSDANDCFSMAVPVSGPNSLGDGGGGSGPNSLPGQGSSMRNGDELREMHRVQSDNQIKYEDSSGLSQRAITSPTDTDKDSGQGTLLEELRHAEGDGSPLPSGIWSSSSSPSPQDFQIQPRQENGIRSNSFITPKETPCCLGSPKSNVKKKSRSKKQNHENSYLSFEFCDQFMGPDPSDSDQKLPKCNTIERERVKEETLLLPQRTFKVILAGDAAVGKTTFIERVCHGHFTPNLSSTIGVDFRVKTVELEGQAVALQLWDTAGQERFRSLTKSYFRRADGVILMYDVTNERTFLSIRHWIQNVEEGAGRKVPIVLCGNKSDLRESYGGQMSGCVKAEDGVKLGAQCEALFIETSPKTGDNVLQALVILAREMSLVEDLELKNSVKLQDSSEDEKKGKRGCCGGGSATNNNSSNTSK